MTEHINSRLRGEYLNDVTVLLDEIERLRAEAYPPNKHGYRTLQPSTDLRKQEAELEYLRAENKRLRKQEAELEYLRTENKRLKEERFDLQAADHIVEAVRDVLHVARRLTDMYRLADLDGRGMEHHA